MAARVLWLIKGLDRGGAETLLTLVAPRIDRDRFEVELAYLMPQASALRSKLEDAGVRTVCLEARGDLHPGWVLRLRRLLRQHRYDLVHTHSPLAASAARLCAPRSTVLVHTEHNLWSGYRRSTRLANAVTYPRNRLVMAVSDSVKGSIRKPAWMPWATYPPVRTARNGVVLETGVATSPAREAARSGLGIDPARPVIGSVASLTAEKDHASLLDALRSVRQRHPDVLLLVVGSGPLEADVRGLVDRYGLGGNVRLLGPRADVGGLLPALDVFALSSHYEGLPVSMLEAMATGLPIVASAVGGIPEAITDEVEGWLVPRGDLRQLAQRLAQLLADPERRDRMGRHARARVEGSFAIDRLVYDIDSAYTDALLAPLGR